MSTTPQSYRTRHRRQWNKKRLWFLLLILLLPLLAIGIYRAASDTEPGRGPSGAPASPAPAVAPTFNWVASLELPPGTFYANGKGECWGFEVEPGATVQLLDSTGDIISSTELLRGTVVGVACRMSFLFIDIPEGYKAYTFSSAIGTKSFTETEMHKTGVVHVS